MRRRRGIMGLNGGAGTPVITATATGNPLSFVTDLVRQLKSLMIPFTPIQEGSGDPSPTNVRPISGWTGCEITHTGKNLLDSSSLVSGKYIDNNGREQTNSSFGYTRPYSAILPNTTYILSGSWTHQHDYYCAVYFYDTNKEWIKRNTFDSLSTTYTFTTPENAGYIRVQYYKSLANAQVETGSTVTSFEPFQGYTVIPVSFTDPTTSDPLTVYGGTLTLNEDGSADLTNEYEVVELSNYTWNTSYYSYGFFCYLPSRFKTQPVQTQPFDGYCETYIVTPWGKQTKPTSNWISMRVSGGYGWIVKTDGTHDVTPSGKLCMALKEPATYHFDNIGQLVTFLGTNTIWTDTNGTNTATYLKHQS